ncbi:hypothetical protein ACEQHX_000521 [Campylobacter lari]|uniref:hypothetical protein n=1 Tax=Campylobacter lari TaxID=201 RepID=UPI0021C0C47C|nr:hypothetical protein [Campylobacter lari]
MINLASLAPIVLVLTHSSVDTYLSSYNNFSLQKINTIENLFSLQKINTIENLFSLQKTNTTSSEKIGKIHDKDYEIQHLSNLIVKTTGYNIISINEFKDNIENKISLVFNMDSPDNISVDELEEINKKTHDIFSQKKYFYIDSFMVL